MPREHYHFLTGELAAAALRSTVAAVAREADFDYSIEVLPITVAAMISPRWAARRVHVPAEATRVVVPGYCAGELTPLEEAAGRPVERGPKDLRQLPEYFGGPPPLAEHGEYAVEILAQVRDARRLSLGDVLHRGKRLGELGADTLVLYGDAEPWTEIGDIVRALVDDGRRVAVDSRRRSEVEAAVKAGATLAFSATAKNVADAIDWGCEVVVAPETPGSLKGVEEVAARLQQAGVAYRINPVLAPIGFGFAESLGRYLAVRWQWPEAPLLMNLATVVEPAQADSAGMNLLLVAFCEEMGVRSIVVGQDANPARTSVRECDLARQLVHYALRHHTMPKQLAPGLAMLRDAKLYDRGLDEMLDLASAIRDWSFRIFAESGRLHAITAGTYIDGADAYELFEQMQKKARRPISADYAFYLGYELCKAVTALTLGKNYRQDEALQWGMLTIPELTRRERRARKKAAQAEEAAREPPP